jgi:hypothetical protein
VAELKREVARPDIVVALLIQREDAQIYIPDRFGVMQAYTRGVQTAGPLFSPDNACAAGLKPAAFLPTTRAEMDALGWDQCDVIIVTGDAYVDHPSFGMAIIGRVSRRKVSRSASSRSPIGIAPRFRGAG